MEQPLISVIVPVYKVAPWLDDCVNTLLSQTYTNLEILLIDDGSPDNCGELCDRWAEKDARIRVIHQENAGLSGARNTGLEIAVGEYIMFVDSDDLLSPHLCQTLLDAMGDGDISICDPVHIFPDKPWQFSTEGTLSVYTPEEAIVAMWYQTAFLPSAWGKLYRASLFQSRRFTVGRLFEDIDIMHEVFWDASKITYTTAQLYGYMHRENSITTQSFSKRDLDILLVAQKLADFAQDKPALKDAATAYMVTAALRVYLNAPDKPELQEGICQAKNWIDTYGKAVKNDPRIRRKNRLALQLYFFCKPLMRFSYKFINRWK